LSTAGRSFWRKHEKEIGTGLGLTIRKELVTKLEGSIGVEETPGGGAPFKVSLAMVEKIKRPPSDCG
jgi:signal transduction histidine kinase